MSLLTVLSAGTLVGILMLLMHLYIYRYAPAVWRRQRQILLDWAAHRRHDLRGAATSARPLYTALFAAGGAVSMLIAVLINTNVAVLVTVVLAVLTGMVATGNNLDGTALYSSSGSPGILSLTRVEKVNSFAVAGAFIALASFLTALSLRLLVGTPVDGTLLETLALEALS